MTVINAIWDVLGSVVKIQECCYHFTQETWCQVQDLGLVTLHNSDNNLKQFVKMLDAVTFLPLHQVQDGMKLLKDICPEQAEPLVD